MNTEFQGYNSCVVAAFNQLIRADDLVAKKSENFVRLLKAHSIQSVLHLGFGPTAIGLKKAGYDVSILNGPAPVGFALADPTLRYDAVIAPDEFFTFSESEEVQRNQIAAACDMTEKVLITTLSDYKNMAENSREFSDPQSYKTQDGNVAYLERHTRNGKNSWATKVYRIDQKDEMTTAGPFQRRALYFKQLARIAQDNKCRAFTFQKNMMYKGMLRKSYEHIITLEF